MRLRIHLMLSGASRCEKSIRSTESSSESKHRQGHVTIVCIYRTPCMPTLTCMKNAVFQHALYKWLGKGYSNRVQEQKTFKLAGRVDQALCAQTTLWSVCRLDLLLLPMTALKQNRRWQNCSPHSSSLASSFCFQCLTLHS